MKIRLLLIVAILSTQLPANADPEIKGTAAELKRFLVDVPATVTISGEAEVRVPAQRAVLSLKVVTENRSLQEALRQNADIRGRLAEQLRKQGVPVDRIHASRFSSTPKFGILSDKARSYRVENLVRIVVHDEREFHGAAGGIDSWSEVQFVGLDFEYADKDLLKQNAISQACDNANQRKAIYEQKFGLKLRPIGFDEGVWSQRNMMGDNYRLRPYASSGSAPSMAQPEVPPRGMVAGEATESASPFGEMVYTARVVLECRVEPN